MADKYIPEPYGEIKEPEDILAYLQRELTRIADYLGSVQSTEFEELTAEPERPRERQLYFADGINWNPGHGRGMYTLINGIWFPVAATNMPPPPPEEPPPPPEEEPGEPGPLPPETGRAVATFHSMSIYWTPPSPPAGAAAVLEYRVTGTSTWKRAHDMWYDSRNNECRGKVFYLDSDTEYDFQFGLVFGTPLGGLRARTWSETFPIGTTVEVASRNSTLVISEGGTPGAYRLYQPPGGTIGGATIDVKNQQFSCVNIQAPYVILRGFIIKESQGHAIRLLSGAHDVIIEHNDISKFGRPRNPPLTQASWTVAQDGDSGVHAFQVACDRLVIQYNNFHDPRYGANSWDIGHPHGSNAIYLHDSGHNQVFRWNTIKANNTEDITHFFMDGIGGSDNFGNHGVPGSDSDVYGNYVQGCMDDAIEAEGGEKCVGVWGNYADLCPVAIGSTVVNTGPQYIFRNVHNRARKLWTTRTWDTDLRLYAFKAAQAVASAKGRRYIYHNTVLQHPPSAGFNLTQGTEQGVGSFDSQPLVNTIGRNNILHVWKSHIQSVKTSGGADNSFNYDLYNGTIDQAGHETNGVKNTPTYKAGHGPTNFGKYQLGAGTPGHDAGVVLNNFNDGFLGTAPDMGAHEEGMPDMVFGHLGSGKGPGEPP